MPFCLQQPKRKSPSQESGPCPLAWLSHQQFFLCKMQRQKKTSAGEHRETVGGWELGPGCTWTSLARTGLSREGQRLRATVAGLGRRSLVFGSGGLGFSCPQVLSPERLLLQGPGAACGPVPILLREAVGPGLEA